MKEIFIYVGFSVVVMSLDTERLEKEYTKQYRVEDFETYVKESGNAPMLYEDVIYPIKEIYFFSVPLPNLFKDGIIRFHNHKGITSEVLEKLLWYPTRVISQVIGIKTDKINADGRKGLITKHVTGPYGAAMMNVYEGTSLNKQYQ